MRALPILLLILLALLPPAVVQAAPTCFPEAAPAITHCIDGRFGAFWQQQGGLPVFGYPLEAQHEEPALAGAISVQRFERERLELHPENAAPYDVLLGRLGADVLEHQGRDWRSLPRGDAGAPHFFAETGHAIAPQFWGYWSSHGLAFDGQAGTSFPESLALFGMPLSEATMEINPTDGRQYLTQWFERARFEEHPENAGTPYTVLLGLLQRELDDAAPAPQPPPVALNPGGFIEVAGSQLTRLGQPVRLKGVNYYPQQRPWMDMWTAWDGQQIERELRLARDQLGINAVRVLVPYNLSDKDSGAGVVTAELLGRMHELTQIAGSLDLRLIVTLFDFYEDFPASGSVAEQRNFAYLRTLIGNFTGDDRIIAWDLHNEPDQYAPWKDGYAPQVLTWLGRMADEVHRLAPNHLVTVGMGQYDNLLAAGPDGRRVIDYSDVISVHSYNAADVARQLDEVRGQTTKPILLEEFGWPTGITCLTRSYNEDSQAQVYRDTLAAARDRVAGVFAWNLRDYDSGPIKHWGSREDYFGLYRADGSLKPAAQELRLYDAPPLPSTVSTNLPLTATGPNIPDGDWAPLAVGDHYVKSWFRSAWELLGGQSSFGMPLTDAFVIPGATPKTDRVLQYFEAGALELHPEAAADPDFRFLLEIDKVQRIVVPLGLGAEYVSRNGITTGSAKLRQFQSFYTGIHGDWRLGAPITGELVETVNGVSTTVQYFQRGSLQWNPATQTIEVGRQGTWAWNAQCQSAP